MKPEDEADEIIDYIADKWKYFVETIKLSEEVDLAEKIWMFSKPIHAGMLVKGGVAELTALSRPDAFWEFLLVGIHHAGMQSKDELNAAFKELGIRHFSKPKNIQLIPYIRIIIKLDSPIKRVGFVILVIGIVMLLLGFIQIANYPFGGDLLDRFWRAVMVDHSDYRRYWAAAWGTYLVVGGLLLSFLYDLGIGRLVKWVRGDTK